MKTDRTMEMLKKSIRDYFGTLRRFTVKNDTEMINFLVYQNLRPLIQLLGECKGISLDIHATDTGYRLMTHTQYMAFLNSLTSL